MLSHKITVIAILAGATTAFAQVQAGRMVGTIYDPQHANVAGAQQAAELDADSDGPSR